MKTIDRGKQLGKKLVTEAKEDMASRKKSSNHNLNQAVLSNVSHEVRQPMSVCGDPTKAFEYRRRNKIECCICGISAGVFYIKNGEKFCSQHKGFICMSQDERKEELSKC